MPTFGVSPGVFTREIDRSVTTAPAFGNVGAVVISANRGPIEPTLITSERQFVERFGQPSMDNPSMYSAIYFLKEASSLWVNRVVVDAIVATTDISVTINAGQVDEATEILGSFSASSPGAWGNDVKVVIEEVEDRTDVVNVVVYFRENRVEEFEVSFDPSAKDGFGNNIFVETRINGRSNYIVVDFTPVEGFNVATGAVFELANGANDTNPVSDPQVIAGIEAFSNTDQYSIDYVLNGGWTSAGVHSAITSLCEGRRDCVGVLDLPNEDDATALVEFRKNVSAQNSSFVAYYSGWVRVVDTYTGLQLNLPPSGFVGAVFAFSQSQGQVWDAPAGFRRGRVSNVIGLANDTWNGPERDLLYKNQINPIVDQTGVVVWGQKTSQVIPSSFDRVNVRFCSNFILNSLTPSLYGYVFEGNTEFTRDSVNALCSNFLEDIKQQGGITGYKVVTDESINTPQVIDNNQMLIEVFVAFTRSAEMIRLDLISVPTGTVG